MHGSAVLGSSRFLVVAQLQGWGRVQRSDAESDLDIPGVIVEAGGTGVMLFWSRYGQHFTKDSRLGQMRGEEGTN